MTELIRPVENEDPVAEDGDGLNPTVITKRQTEFYGIGAEDWLGLIIKVRNVPCMKQDTFSCVVSSAGNDELNDQYCMILASRHEERLALEILEHTIWGNIFFNYRSELAFRITIIGKLWL